VAQTLLFDQKKRPCGPCQASIGAILLLLKAPMAVLVLTVGFGPSAIYHLLFQDPTFLRYALPVGPRSVVHGF
jgi:hypothetical protein